MLMDMTLDQKMSLEEQLTALSLNEIRAPAAAVDQTNQNHHQQQPIGYSTKFRCYHCNLHNLFYHYNENQIQAAAGTGAAASFVTMGTADRPVKLTCLNCKANWMVIG